MNAKKQFIPSDILDKITNDHETGWDEESREFLLCQFIADHCDLEVFTNYIQQQAIAEKEEADHIGDHNV